LHQLSVELQYMSALSDFFPIFGDPRQLWAGAGPPGGTVRRAAVRKRGPGSQSLSEHRLPE